MRAGELLCVLGSKGSGKSCLLELIRFVQRGSVCPLVCTTS